MFIALGVACGTLLLHAQNAEDLLEPDGGAREVSGGIFVPALPKAPFSAVVQTVWNKRLSDGNTDPVKTFRVIMRDGKGRIYQERRTFVPDGSSEEPRIIQIEITDPESHTKYSCDASLKRCKLRGYTPALSYPVVPVGLIDNGRLYLSRTSLGTKTIQGIEVIGTREIVSVGQGTAAKPTPIDFIRELWYSPKLGIDLQLARTDPAHGDQTFSVISLSVGEPDANLFAVPERARVSDLRENGTQATASVPTQ